MRDMDVKLYNAVAGTDNRSISSPAPIDEPAPDTRAVSETKSEVKRSAKK